MFEPQYSISNLLLSNIKRITEIIADLNSRSFSGIVLAELEKRAREISAFSSTSIEGNPLPLTDVKRILKTRPEHIRDSEREVLNYNKALVDLNDSMKNKKQTFDLPLILKIQKTITQDLIEEYRSGKLRQEPVFVNNPKTLQTVFFPPEHLEVSGLMSELFDYIKKNKSRIAPLILAGIFHKQFVIIHPFIDGNGRTARLATKVLLAKMGLDTFNLFSFENYYNQNVSKYFQTVGEYGDYNELVASIDFTVWLEYFTGGLIDELLRVEKLLPKVGTTPDTRLEPYHLKILEYIKQNGFIADRNYAPLSDRALATRTLDFQKLLDLGLIERKGKGRSTYYTLKEN